MTVQSARVQELVKGDDVSLSHQIMGDVAFSAEASRAPVTLSGNDLVNFFYPLGDSSVTDLIGYPGTPLTAYPCSQFSVAVPGVIPASGSAVVRGSSTFQAGLARTVRAEISRFVLATTGDSTNGSAAIANVGSVAGLAVGDGVTGAGVPFGAVVAAIAGNTVTLSLAATATATGVSLRFSKKESHYLIAEVDIYERGFPSSLIDTSGSLNLT